MNEHAGSQKYIIDNFFNFEMTGEKSVSSQIHEFHVLLNYLKNEEIDLHEHLWLVI